MPSGNTLPLVMMTIEAKVDVYFNIKTNKNLFPYLYEQVAGFYVLIIL